MTGYPDALGADALEALTSTERAVFGTSSTAYVWTMISSWCRQRLGSGIARIRFRAGRVDAVWGVELEDGRQVVIKTHRPPVDTEALRVARDAQDHLWTAGFPAPQPIAGPELHAGHVLSAESLLRGDAVDGRDRGQRMLLAAGLHRHIDLLRDRPDLLSRGGTGPSWCRYRSGPWPIPHDTIVDFTSTPSEFAWLDELGRRSSEQIVAHRDGDQLVLGHADWYAGNALVEHGRLSGTVDWQLVADAEAVIAGFAAACYASSSTGGGGLSTPAEVADFMIDYDTVRGAPLDAAERRTAAGAAAWILAFNARWQVGLLAHDLADHSVIDLVHERRQDYLSLSW